MAKIEHVETGKALTTEQEIPPFMTCGVEIYDEEMDELNIEDRIELEGEEYRVIESGAEFID